MVINLGLVELGGQDINVDEPNFSINGYLFKFVDKDPSVGEIRMWYNIKRYTGYYEHKHAELRVFVNYDSAECLALAVKWLTMFREHYESIHLLFPNGNIVTIKN